METKAEIEVLEAGGSIEKAIHEDITYLEMYDSRDNLWNFLYFTGYLKKINERFEDRTLYATICIPNEEVHTIYHNHIMEFKVAKKSQEIESAAFKALEQSQLKEYMEGVEAEGFTDITCYGIGFFKKNCKVRMF